MVVEPCGGGRYHGQLDHSWDLVAVPQGGIVASLALRAASLEIGDPGQLLRTCTTVFAGQVAAGPLDIHVSVLRRGRSATQVQAAVRNKGAEAGASIVAVFGSSRRGPSFVDAVPPEVPPPLACPSYREPPPPGIQPFEPLPFWARVEGRAALGHPPWEQHEPTGSDVATWLRFDSPPQLADGAIDPLGVLTLADRMPGCVAERLGHQGPPWFAPSADLTVHLLEPLRTEWLLAHDRARWADDGWASAESVLLGRERDSRGLCHPDDALYLPSRQARSYVIQRTPMSTVAWANACRWKSSSARVASSSPRWFMRLNCENHAGRCPEVPGVVCTVVPASGSRSSGKLPMVNVARSA